ncbi:MAG: PilZ domain-containing protein [Deltaproteobacteria bacterium]|nr:PilZ domain-containing protein [Deltaproteobacteria bacterium]
MDEKRLTLRRKWRSKIVFEDEFGQELIYLYSKDISEGGVFLEDVPPLKMGALAFLSFVIPGKKRPLKATGQVVRFVEYGPKGRGKAKRGAGIRFIDMDSASFKQLTDFIQK